MLNIIHCIYLTFIIIIVVSIITIKMIIIISMIIIIIINMTLLQNDDNMAWHSFLLFQGYEKETRRIFDLNGEQRSKMFHMQTTPLSAQSSACNLASKLI